MLSFACPAGGKSAAAALGRVASPAPGLCWGAGQKGKRYTCAAKAGLLDVGCSTCLLPALCCLKGTRVGAVREPAIPQERKPLCSTATWLFFTCVLTPTAQAHLARPGEPDTIHQIC